MSILSGSRLAEQYMTDNKIIHSGVVGRTWTFWHFVLGSYKTLLLYRPNKIIQCPVQVQTSCMLDLFRDSWAVHIVEDGSLRKDCENFAVKEHVRWNTDCTVPAGSDTEE